MEAETKEPIEYDNHYLFVVHIENDKIVEVEEYFDPIMFGKFLNSLFAQIPPPES